MSNNNTCKSYARDEIGSGKEYEPNNSSTDLKDGNATKYYERSTKHADMSDKMDGKGDGQLNETFYTGRNEGDDNTPAIDRGLVYKLLKDNSDLFSNLFSRIDGMDATINNNKVQYLNDFSNLKSLVHSFININEKKDISSELASIKDDFKRLSSDFDRTVNINKTLNESLQREINLLSSSVSDNKMDLEKLQNMSLSSRLNISGYQSPSTMDKFEADCERIKSQISDLVNDRISNLVKEMEKNVENTKEEVLDAFEERFKAIANQQNFDNDSLQANVENMVEKRIIELTQEFNNKLKEVKSNLTYSAMPSPCGGGSNQMINEKDIDMKIDAIVKSKNVELVKSNEKFINDIQLNVESMIEEFNTNFYDKLSNINKLIKQNNLMSQVNDSLVNELEAKFDGKLTKLTKKIEQRIDTIASETSGGMDNSLHEKLEKLTQMINITSASTQSFQKMVNEMEKSVYGKVADLSKIMEQKISTINEHGEMIDDLKSEIGILCKKNDNSENDSINFRNALNELEVKIYSKITDSKNSFDQKIAVMEKKNMEIQELKLKIEDFSSKAAFNTHQMLDSAESNFNKKISDLKDYVNQKISVSENNSLEINDIKSKLDVLPSSSSMTSLSNDIKSIGDKLFNLTKTVDQKSTILENQQTLIKQIESKINEKLSTLALFPNKDTINDLEKKFLSITDNLKGLIEKNKSSNESLKKSTKEIINSFNDKFENFSQQIQMKVSSSISDANHTLMKEIESSLNERIIEVESMLKSQIQTVNNQHMNPGSINNSVPKSVIEPKDDELGKFKLEFEKKFGDELDGIRRDTMDILHEIFEVLNKNQEQIDYMNSDLNKLVEDTRIGSLQQIITTHGSHLETIIQRIEALSSKQGENDSYLSRLEKITNDKIARVESIIDRDGLLERINSLPTLEHITAQVYSLVTQQITSLNIDVIHEKLSVLENEVIPTFNESINELMDSAIHNISSDLINKSVEKIIYEILDKLEDRIASIRGLKDSVKPPQEQAKLTIQERPVHLVSGENVQARPIRALQSQQSVATLKADLLATIDCRTNLMTEENKMVMRKFSNRFASEIEAVNSDFLSLRYEFNDFKDNMNQMIAQLIGTIQKNSNVIDGKIKNFEEMETRAVDIFNRIQHNSEALDVKMKSVNDTLQSGSKTIKKLSSLVKKSKDSAKSFEKREYERIWAEKWNDKHDAKGEGASPNSLNYYYSDKMGSDEYNQFSDDNFNPSTFSSPKPRSPVIERYVVPLNDTQFTVTRQYLQVSDVDQIQNVSNLEVDQNNSSCMIVLEESNNEIQLPDLVAESFNIEKFGREY